MPIYNVNIKWSKELFNNVELNTDEPPLIFKAQLFALSGVAPERQKIMVKGKIIGDNDWSNVASVLQNGLTLMMMGSVDKLPEAPAVQTKFIEDLTESQIAQALDLPVGLKNLGNTCYLNAVVQCLKSVPELCSGLSRYKNAGGDMSGSLTIALRDTYELMDKNKNDYPPLLLVQLVRTVFPQFSAMGENGVPMQQDANECLTELLRVLQQKLPRSSNAKAAHSGLIDQYFSGEFTCEMKCDEAPEESSSQSFESFLQLSCFINQDVKYLQTGLKLRLEEKLTKNSPSLNRDALYTKASRISRLPGYLCIQLVRFFYKEKEKVSAKVLKDVKFPIILDVFDLCTSDLQKKLVAQRELFRIQDEEENNVRKAKKLEELKQDGKGTEVKKPDESEKVEYAPFSFPDDEGSNNSGFYELQAVLTHKGRSANSGHYVGWAKHHKTNEWFMYDDDNVNKVSEEEILKLSGGGDWHTAYVLFYGPRKLNSKYLIVEKQGDQAVSAVGSTQMKVD